jgi:2-hydroxychromene-2-carboxylate isomerase
VAAPSARFLYDFGSPNAYLAHRVLPEIEARTGVPFEYVPVLLGGVFKATGNASPAITLQGIRNKPQYEALEIRRFLAKHAIDDFRMNPHFPVNTLRLMRGAVFARREGFGPRYVDAIFRHMWCEPRKMDDPPVFAAALAESGLPVDAVVEGIERADVKDELRAETERAVAQGVFGAPSFFVDGELFFGKDRLREVEEEILRRAGTSP